jgi:hypothetical protein
MEEKNTIELYTVKELIELDHSYYRKIVNSKDYIPVKISNSRNRYDYKIGKIKKDYCIKYIRRKDVEKYLKK